MAIKYKHTDEFSTYFVTFTCYKWIPLFEKTSSYDLVYNWFKILNQEGVDIIAFVIMPNHLHVILHFPEPGFDLNKVISNGKRFMAYEIVNRLEEKRDTAMLQFLAYKLTKREIAKGQKHKIFKNSFDAKPIYSDKFLFQKLDYIHFNPVKGKWSLAKDYLGYEYSSAAFYELQKINHFAVKHYLDI